jgi:hypothetical protein
MENETELIEQTQEQSQVQETPVFERKTFGQDVQQVQRTEAVQGTSTETQEQVPQELNEEGVSSFSMPTFGGEQIVETQEEQQFSDWKEEIKKQDRREVLKAAGLSDFAIDFAEYYEGGNDPYKYLEAKSFDWNKVGDIEVLIQDYKEQYPTFEESQIERLIAKKYGFIENGDDEDNADALLMAKADAHISRQQKIKEQQAFVIPSVSKLQEAAATQQNNEQLMIEQQQIAAQEYENAVSFYREHEATKNLVQTKRVGVDLGTDKPFYFNVDKPELITKAITDGDFWRRITASNPQEVDSDKLIPDVAKMQKIVMAAINPNYEKDIFNYGKSFGLKNVIEEGQNARKPNGTNPSVSHDSPTSAWSRAEVKSFGRN